MNNVQKCTEYDKLKCRLAHTQKWNTFKIWNAQLAFSSYIITFHWYIRNVGVMALLSFSLSLLYSFSWNANRLSLMFITLHPIAFKSWVEEKTTSTNTHTLHNKAYLFIGSLNAYRDLYTQNRAFIKFYFIGHFSNFNKLIWMEVCVEYW